MNRSKKQDPLRNETEIIGRIWQALPTRAGKRARDWLRLGVGDDAAVIRATGRKGTMTSDWVLSTDAFLEGVHFLPAVHAPGNIGYKALARATSDLAAMGASPRFFLLGIALPPNRTGKWLDGFLKGMAYAAHEYGMVLIGGDTSRFSTVAMNIVVGGEAVRARGRNVLTRCGARPGDLIYVSGTLGAAQLGLEIILHGLNGNAKEPQVPRGGRWKGLALPHLRPIIHLALGQWLAGKNSSKYQMASAAIDTSDGLSTDLNHICLASSVGARLWAKKIPAVRIPDSLCRHGTRLDPLTLALHGGEDYQLLFTVSPAVARRLPRQFHGVPLTQIGEIVPAPTKAREDRSCIELVTFDGKANSLKPQGWDPFTAHFSRKNF